MIVHRARRIQYGPGVFRPLGEAELARLDVDALIAYVRAARLHGHESARVALAVLVYGHCHNVARRSAPYTAPPRRGAGHRLRCGCTDLSPMTASAHLRMRRFFGVSQLALQICRPFELRIGILQRDWDSTSVGSQF